MNCINEISTTFKLPVFCEPSTHLSYLYLRARGSIHIVATDFNPLNIDLEF